MTIVCWRLCPPQGPSWVNLDRNRLAATCPVYPRSRPNYGHRWWSGSCQQPTRERKAPPTKAALLFEEVKCCVLVFHCLPSAYRSRQSLRSLRSRYLRQKASELGLPFYSAHFTHIGSPPDQAGTAISRFTDGCRTVMTAMVINVLRVRCNRVTKDLRSKQPT
jgi:hypothetical protein